MKTTQKQSAKEVKKDDFQFWPEGIKAYNLFVRLANKKKLLFTSFELTLGITEPFLKKGFIIKMETSPPMTTEEAKETFYEFIDKYPQCGIDYNIAPEQTELEKALYRMAETVLYLAEGFQLHEINE